MLLDFRNNVIYDWGGMCGYGANERFRLNYVGNFLKAGPSTAEHERKTVFHVGGPGNRIFLSGNLLEGFSEADEENTLLLAWPKDLAETECSSVLVPASQDAPPVTTQAVRDAFAAVLSGVGATLPKRDAVDARIVEEVRNGGGHIIDSQREVGGWPEYVSGPAPEDKDGDGIPDTWETAHGLNPEEPKDGSAVANGGYTNLEEYLNALAPKM